MAKFSYTQALRTARELGMGFEDTARYVQSRRRATIYHEETRALLSEYGIRETSPLGGRMTPEHALKIAESMDLTPNAAASLAMTAIPNDQIHLISGQSTAAMIAGLKLHGIATKSSNDGTPSSGVPPFIVLGTLNTQKLEPIDERGLAILARFPEMQGRLTVSEDGTRLLSPAASHLMALSASSNERAADPRVAKQHRYEMLEYFTGGQLEIDRAAMDELGRKLLMHPPETLSPIAERWITPPGPQQKLELAQITGRMDIQPTPAHASADLAVKPAQTAPPLRPLSPALSGVQAGLAVSASAAREDMQSPDVAAWIASSAVDAQRIMPPGGTAASVEAPLPDLHAISPSPALADQPDPRLARPHRAG